MLDLELLTCQYPILARLASFISTLDLYHLALTNKANNSYILQSKRTFDAVKRQCICDGHGLKDRQAFEGLYSLKHHHYHWGDNRHIWRDEPIEVRVWGTECDPSDTHPCRKCNINVCEECRYYPREPPHPNYPVRRPHLNSPWQNENLMCLCPPCDENLEKELQGRFLSELCDCDVFTRWICNKCRLEELNFTRDYYANHTKSDDDDYDEAGVRSHSKSMFDHQHGLNFYCICGVAIPQETRPRCTWCKRRHLPEDQWHEEWEEIGCKMPMFEEDPCYPPFIGDIYATSCDKPYPKLKYDGPIWQAPDQPAASAEP